MINVEKIKLISFDINRRIVKLLTKDNDVIFREIINPVGEKLEDVKSYLCNSLPKIESFELLTSEIGICFVDENSIEKIMDSPNSIDRYWIDGKTYLVDCEHDSHNNNFLLVAIDLNLDKNLVINSLKNNAISNDIHFVDELSNCWIKKIPNQSG